jgi:hypothetical protein
VAPSEACFLSVTGLVRFGHSEVGFNLIRINGNHTEVDHPRTSSGREFATLTSMQKEDLVESSACLRRVVRSGGIHR